MQKAFTAADEALLELGCALRNSGYRFTTVTPATHALVIARPQNARAKDLNGVFGWSLPFQENLVAPDLFDLMQRGGILEPHDAGWRSRVRVSTLGEQLIFHSAYPTTAADAVFFGPDTYRFVAAIKRHLAVEPAHVGRAVDICCGAGPGALAIAEARPRSVVLGTDINDQALRLARINGALAGLENTEFLYSDLLSAAEGDFDLIVANPPYLADPSERAYRHGGGPLGAGLSLAIVEAALKRLAPNGTLLLYTGAAIIGGADPFREEVVARLGAIDCRWHYEELDPDVFGEELLNPAYANTERIAAVLLTVRR